MKVYTGTGDQGQTNLFSGERVAKHNVRIDAYGDLDELNSLVGAIAALSPQNEAALAQDLAGIQRRLFAAGAWLATTPGSSAEQYLAPFPPAAARELEERIDALSAHLPELRSFILPGGVPVAAWAHVGRTVCRRAERKLTLLMASEEGSQHEGLIAIQVYLNRLSDYLFTAARYLNQQLGQGDVPVK